MSLNLDELRDLLTTINGMDIAEVTLKNGDFELTVRRGWRADEQLLAVESARMQWSSGGSPLPLSDSPAESSTPEAKGNAEGLVPAVSPTTAMPPKSDRRWVEILSPMVGTFYRSPAPDELPFVDLGDRIRTGQTVCIIEAMKLMNEIEAEVAGEIIEILVQNGEPVEYNQPLMRVSNS